MNLSIFQKKVMIMYQISPDYKKRMQQFWVLLLGVFAVHNLEEAIFDMYEWEMTHNLPSWMETGSKFHTSIQLTPTKILIIAFFVGVVVSSIAYLLRNRPRASRYWMTTFVVIMLGVYLGHVVASLYARSPMPGVYSAALLGLPVYSFVLYRLWQSPSGMHG
jgi:hypothetical protein